MKNRPKLKRSEILAAFLYYLVFVRYYTFKESTETWEACENWQIEELAYKGLARRKHDPRGWNRMISRFG